MRAIIDGDIIRYEIAYAAETGWKAITGTEETPAFDYVEQLLNQRIENIKAICQAEEATIYYTSGRTFRYDIAKTKPYKGTRLEKKPFHFSNITVWLRDILGAKEVKGIEADDAMAIDHINSEDETVLVSRDKDLYQIPGMFYRWELGNSPSFGPEIISKEGSLHLSEKNKLTGTGYAWFLAQTLMGDSVDNIPGCKGVGPVRTYELLNGVDMPQQLENTIEEYKRVYGEDWEKNLMEQGKLTWICRRMNPDQTPQTWDLSLTE